VTVRNVETLYVHDRDGRHGFRVAWTDGRGEDRRTWTTPADTLRDACRRLEALLAVITSPAPQINGGARP
jgi:hypothetical protein